MEHLFIRRVAPQQQETFCEQETMSLMLLLWLLLLPLLHEDTHRFSTIWIVVAPKWEREHVGYYIQCCRPIPTLRRLLNAISSTPNTQDLHSLYPERFSFSRSRARLTPYNPHYSALHRTLHIERARLLLMAVCVRKQRKEKKIYSGMRLL